MGIAISSGEDEIHILEKHTHHFDVRELLWKNQDFFFHVFLQSGGGSVRPELGGRGNVRPQIGGTGGGGVRGV